MRTALLILVSLAAGCSEECFIEGAGCESELPPLTYIAITAGTDHTCGTVLDNVLCWGDGPNPPRGIEVVKAAGDSTCGLDSDGNLACAVPGPAIDYIDGPFVDFSISKTHTCGIRGVNQLVCWYAAPPPPRTDFDTVVAGVDHTCGTRAGVTTCWGRNEVGQANAPAIALDGIVAADGYTCGLDAGAIVCWGNAPSPIPTGGFVELAAADDFMCGVRTDHTLACWGDPLDGRTSPPSGEFIALAVGDRHGCAITMGNGVACWGANDAGQAAPP